MMRSRRAWLAPFLAVALITAACGGGDDAADEVSEATDEGDAGDAEPTEDATQPGADGEEMMAPTCSRPRRIPGTSRMPTAPQRASS